MNWTLRKSDSNIRLILHRSKIKIFVIARPPDSVCVGDYCYNQQKKKVAKLNLRNDFFHQNKENFSIHRIR